MEMTDIALRQDQKKVEQLMELFRFVVGRCPGSACRTRRQRKPSGGLKTRRRRPTKIADRAMPSAKPTLVAARRASRASTEAYSDIMAVRVAKQKGFVDAMYQTEKSHIPQPDDPPIVYPDAEVWKELTARRKGKYSSTSLSKPSPAERRSKTP